MPQFKLLTIDAYNVIRRVYGANPAPDSDEKAQACLRASRQSLRRALLEHKPTHAALVFDAEGPNWRHQVYPKYKLERKPMPAPLRDAMPYFQRELRVAKWHLLEMPGVEADDVIGSLAVEAEHAGFEEHVILSTDKDIASLVQYGARVYNHFEQRWHDEAWLLGKMGVRPDQVLDFLALMGDASDGIPGVEKVGLKTAAKLLQEHETLEGVLSAAVNIPGALGKRLREQADIARLSRKLTELKTDLFATQEPDWSAMTALFAPGGA